MKKHIHELRSLIRQRNIKVRQLSSVGPFVAASLSQFKRRCGKSYCHCAKGEGHPAYILTFKEKRKTIGTYVPKDKIEEVTQWVENYNVLKTLIKEISLLNIQMLKMYGKVKRERRGI